MEDALPILRRAHVGRLLSTLKHQLTPRQATLFAPGPFFHVRQPTVQRVLDQLS